jgi:quercetin dioxygenase-like cupin family protein
MSTAADIQPASDARILRWSDLPQDRPMPLIERQRIIGAHMMLSRVHLHRGFRVGTHQHANEQFACVMSGRVRFGLGSDDTPGRAPGAARREVTLGPGEVLHLPPNVPHSAEALEDSVVLDLFSPPSETTGVDAHT